MAHLTAPTAYFLDLVTFISFRPVREDFFRLQGQLYAADADKMLSNGPFVLTEWIHGAALRMEKNPYYWDAQAIKLDAINVPYITTDSNARFNLFMDDKIAMATGLDTLVMIAGASHPIGSIGTSFSPEDTRCATNWTASDDGKRSRMGS